MQQLLGVLGGDRGSQEQQQQEQQHNPLRYDLTELAGLDYLSSPTGVIAQAQRLAAAAFGADRSWLLVNGCSAGIHAAVMAAVRRPGQALLLTRNCHLSAFSACVLAGAEPLWLRPEQDALHGVAHCVAPAELARGFAAARARGASVAAALVVSPTYYGAVARVKELSAICHAEGVPLLVDEAHGGHLTFLEGGGGSSSSSSFGPAPCLGALAAGADVAVQSSHKVLTAMTQAAMLHLQGGRVSHERVSRALQVLQTSSPSYVLMASLDAARRHAASPGAWGAPLAAAAAAREGLARLRGLALLQDGGCGAQGSVVGFDPLRLSVNVQGLGLSGFEAAEWLERRHSVVPELATLQLVVFVIGPGSSAGDAEALVAAFADLCAQQLASRPPPAPPAPRVGVGGGGDGEAPEGPAPLSPREAFFAPTERVAIEAAAGRVSAELLCPYPPGVPLVFPGERLTPAAVDQLRRTLSLGGVVVGAADPELQSVLVVAAADGGGG